MPVYTLELAIGEEAVEMQAVHVLGCQAEPLTSSMWR